MTTTKSVKVKYKFVATQFSLLVNGILPKNYNWNLQRKYANCESGFFDVELYDPNFWIWNKNATCDVAHHICKEIIWLFPWRDSLSFVFYWIILFRDQLDKFLQIYKRTGQISLLILSYTTYQVTYLKEVYDHKFPLNQTFIRDRTKSKVQNVSHGTLIARTQTEHNRKRR